MKGYSGDVGQVGRVVDPTHGRGGPTLERMHLCLVLCNSCRCWFCLTLTACFEIVLFGRARYCALIAQECISLAASPTSVFEAGLCLGNPVVAVIRSTSRSK